MSENLNVEWVGIRKTEHSNILVWGIIELNDDPNKNHKSDWATSSGSKKSACKWNYGAGTTTYYNQKHIAFWGFIGGTLTFKQQENVWVKTKKIDQQITKGFKVVHPDLLNEYIWDNFYNQLNTDFVAFKLENL